MAKKNEVQEKKGLKKLRANFEVVGEVGPLAEWNFNIGSKSDSGFKYNNMKLNIKSEEHNSVSCEAMGGYFPDSVSNKIRVRMKDTSENAEVAWEDRFNDNIIKEISDMSLITIALEKDVNNKLVYKKFLSWYDAIEYVQSRISEGMRVKVRGNLTYSEYNDTVTARKNIQSIYLANDKDVNHSHFSQTVLTTLGDLDSSHLKQDGIVDIRGRVVDYDRDLKQNRAFTQLFKYQVNKEDMEKSSKFLKYLVPTKKGILREITVEGNLMEGASISSVSKDDIPDELKELIDMGLYSEQEILDKMVVKGNKEVSFVITKPMVTPAKEGQLPKLMLDDTKYTLDDLIVVVPEPEEVEEAEKPTASDDDIDKMLSDLSADEENAEEDPLAWMKELEE